MQVLFDVIGDPLPFQESGGTHGELNQIGGIDPDGLAVWVIIQNEKNGIELFEGRNLDRHRVRESIQQWIARQAGGFENLERESAFLLGEAPQPCG
jgi:hypothetical protein